MRSPLSSCEHAPKVQLTSPLGSRCLPSMAEKAPLEVSRLAMYAESACLRDCMTALLRDFLNNLLCMLFAVGADVRSQGEWFLTSMVFVHKLIGSHFESTLTESFCRRKLPLLSPTASAERVSSSSMVGLCGARFPTLHEVVNLSSTFTNAFVAEPMEFQFSGFRLGAPGAIGCHASLQSSSGCHRIWVAYVKSRRLSAELEPLSLFDPPSRSRLKQVSCPHLVQPQYGSIAYDCVPH